MASQITFYRKNIIDLDEVNPSITITDAVATNTGQDSVDFLRNRNNITGWLTSGSTDAANTQMEVYLGDYYDVDFVELVEHNFQDYLIEYNDAASGYLTYENVTGKTESTSIHTKTTAVTTNKIRITITACQTTDADKEMRQLIITSKLHQFNGWPVIKKPVHSQSKKTSKMLSGKVNIVERRGAFSCELDIRLTSDSSDLDFHQSLYERTTGVLMLISGGDETQFRTLNKGYRNKDIVLVRPTDEYENPFYKGVYQNGVRVRMKLAESVY